MRERSPPFTHVTRRSRTQRRARRAFTQPVRHAARPGRRSSSNDGCVGRAVHRRIGVRAVVASRAGDEPGERTTGRRDRTERDDGQRDRHDEPLHSTARATIGALRTTIRALRMVIACARHRSIVSRRPRGSIKARVRTAVRTGTHVGFEQVVRTWWGRCMNRPRGRPQALYVRGFVLRRPSCADRPSSRRSRAIARAGRAAGEPRRAGSPSGLPTRTSRACSRACRAGTARARR